MLSDSQKSTIQTAYRAYLAARDLKPRYGQRLMIAEVARTLGDIETNTDGERVSDNHLTVIEAGTGTGKTLAYLVAAVPLARDRERKLIVSTASVALQEQILFRDLPELMKHTGWALKVSLAKGRRRYLCPSRLEQVLSPGDSQQSFLALWEQAEYTLGREELDFYQQMAAKYGGSWSGDRDDWPDAQIPDRIWFRVTNDHRGCTNRHCRFFDECPFFQARADLQDADLIVANHDLVLADLAMGGGAILSPPESSIYLFDEAHHLPDKALNHFAANCSQNLVEQWLSDSQRMLDELAALAGVGSLPQVLAEQAPAALDALQTALAELVTQSQVWVAEVAERGRERGFQHRFAEGKLPPELATAAATLIEPTATLQKHIDNMVDWLQEGMEGKRPDITRSEAEQWSPVAATAAARAESILAVWQSYAAGMGDDPKPQACWLDFGDEKGSEVSWNASPILAGGVLSAYLWQRAWAVIMTSATLSALGNFNGFRFRAGLPAHAHCVEVPSPFDYPNKAVLRVPRGAVDPGNNQRHTDSIVAYLEMTWEAASATGTLVLFSSRKQMQAVAELLSESVRAHTLVQDEFAKSELLKRHRDAIEGGTPSMLFGLASFAEGIDLPGRYCERVIIARLPFAVPEDPVQATLAEWLEAQGRNPFMEVTVPEAAIRLKQAAGRLLRTENDQGEICLLDRRIIDRRYGRALLNSLPPFRLEVER